MAKKIESTRNMSDLASLSDAIALNSSTSSVVALANDRRIQLSIVNLDKDIWVKQQAATVDDDKKGDFLPKGSLGIIREEYTGEVSAIAVVGTPNIYTTEL